MVAVLVLSVCLQDKGPQDAYEKLENLICQAHAVRVAVNYASDNIGRGRQGSIRLLLKDGNKVLLDNNWTRRGIEWNATIVSNGSKLSLSGNGNQDDRIETPKNLKDNLGVALVRVGGYYTALFATPLSAKSLQDSPDYRKWLKIGNLRFSGNEGQVSTLAYRVTISDWKWKLDVKVWYKAPTGEIMRRVISRLDKEEAAPIETITETYKEVDVGNDILDKEFALPRRNQ